MSGWLYFLFYRPFSVVFSCMLLQPSTPSNVSVLSSLALCFFSLFFALYSVFQSFWSCSFHFNLCFFLSLIFSMFCLLSFSLLCFYWPPDYLCCRISVRLQKLIVFFLWIFYISQDFKLVFHLTSLCSLLLSSSTQPEPTLALFTVHVCSSHWGNLLTCYANQR